LDSPALFKRAKFRRRDVHGVHRLDMTCFAEINQNVPLTKFDKFHRNVNLLKFQKPMQLPVSSALFCCVSKNWHFAIYSTVFKIISQTHSSIGLYVL